MGIFNLVKRFSKTGRKLERKNRSFEKAQLKSRLADVESDIEFRAKEDPREQAQLKQGMFARGLGKSTINAQGNARLQDLQARRRAALERQRDMAHRGLSLIKLRAKAARRMLPFDILEGLIGQDPSLSSLSPGGSDPDSGNSGLGDNWKLDA